jgi:hypothetical protein
MTEKKSNTNTIQITELVLSCTACGQPSLVYVQSKFVKDYCRNPFKCYKCFSVGGMTDDAEGT